MASDPFWTDSTSTNVLFGAKSLENEVMLASMADPITNLQMGLMPVNGYVLFSR